MFTKILSGPLGHNTANKSKIEKIYIKHLVNSYEIKLDKNKLKESPINS